MQAAGSLGGWVSKERLGCRPVEERLAPDDGDRACYQEAQQGSPEVPGRNEWQHDVEGDLERHSPQRRVTSEADSSEVVGEASRLLQECSVNSDIVELRNR